MKNFVIIASLVMLSVVALPADVYKTEWNRFKKTYNRLYTTLEEEDRRFNIFSKNLDKITEHNRLYKKGETNYKMGVNQFTDWTKEEYKKMLGYRKPEVTQDASVLAADNCETEWSKFKKTYNKHYETEEEEQKRFKIFCNNLDKITINNRLYEKGEVTSKMGVNQFADLTYEEMKKRMGYKPRTTDTPSDLPDEVYRTEWDLYKLAYEKEYSTPEEDDRRFKIFINNVKKIIAHNDLFEQGKTTYKMGYNQFTDLTNKEMQERMGVIVKKPDNEICKTEWSHFKVQYNKLYGSQKEEDKRFDIFCKNFNKIMDHNQLYKEGKASFKMGVNKFTDLTEEEMKERMGVLPKKDSDVCKPEWNHFKKTYGKLYESQKEEEKRFDVFCKNFQKILQHNKLYEKGETSFKMDVNEFTDLTTEEMKNRMGYRHPEQN